LSRNPVKVCAILPGDAFLANEPEICLVDECRRLKSVFGPFAPKIRRRALPEFGVDQGHQFLPRVKVALPPRLQQATDWTRF
jgi:hypothetical protein